MSVKNPTIYYTTEVGKARDLCCLDRGVAGVWEEAADLEVDHDALTSLEPGHNGTPDPV